SARGLALRYADGIVWAQPPAQWLAAQRTDAAQRAHDLAGIVFELRQYAALLEAHQLPLRLQSSPAVAAGAGYLLEQLADAPASAPAPRLFAHEAPGLGVVAVSVAQPRPDGAPRADDTRVPAGPDIFLAGSSCAAANGRRMMAWR